jgi:hypothetical protein
MLVRGGALAAWRRSAEKSNNSEIPLNLAVAFNCPPERLQ